MRQVVNDDGALKIGDRGICPVLLSYKCFPTIGIHGVSFNSGIPEIDPSGGASIWRQDIALADKASDVLIFRGCAQEDFSCLISRNRRWQRDFVDDYDHLDFRSGREIELVAGQFFKIQVALLSRISIWRPLKLQRSLASPRWVPLRYRGCLKHDKAVFRFLPDQAFLRAIAQGAPV